MSTAMASSPPQFVDGEECVMRRADFFVSAHAHSCLGRMMVGVISQHLLSSELQQTELQLARLQFLQRMLLLTTRRR